MGYAGGKGRMWQDIVSLMPPHDTYIETHLGGGSVLRNKHPSRRSIGVDIDARVVAAAQTWDVPNLALHEGDAVGFLRDFPIQKRDLVYADPPYVGATKKHRRYYRHEYSDADHVRLLEALLDLECGVMISGYSCELYENALQGWDRKELLNVTHTGPRWEVVWANFAFSADLHDYSNIGGTFRERDRIKRKAARWVRKLELMPVLEQRAVLSALLQSSHVGADFAEHILRDSQRGGDA